MFSIPIIKQDFKINIKQITGCYIAQFVSLLLALGICKMRLIEISDIFWDTIPVVIIPLCMQMMLAYEVVVKRKEDGTMDFILATQIGSEKMITSKMMFMIINTVLLMGISVIFGCLCKVYSLTGVWSQKSYILLNVGGFCLQIFWGGFCFFISALAKNRSFYLKLAVGLPVLQYLLFLGYFLMPELFFLKFITVFTLFDHTLFSKQSALLWVVSVLYLAVGLVFYILGRYQYLKHEDAE